MVVIDRSKPVAERIRPDPRHLPKDLVPKFSEQTRLVPRCALLSIGHGLSRASHETKRIIINLRHDEKESRMAARSYS